MLGLMNQSIDSSIPAPALNTIDANLTSSIDIPNTNPYKQARRDGMMGINEGDGMQIKVSAGPTFGADIVADGSDGVQIKPKKKKKKKFKTQQSENLHDKVAEGTMNLLQNALVTVKEEQPEFNFLGEPVPSARVNEEESALPVISPFGKKKKAKKRKKLPNFDELEIEAFNID